MKNSDPILEVKNLSVAFNGEKVIEDLTFRVDEGEVLAVIGPNGSGKTTLFRALLGLVRYEGKISSRYDKTNFGYVPQRLSVDRDLPLSAGEFLRLKEHSASEIHETIGRTHFSENLLTRRIGLLSGGEFQRLVISWALLGAPRVLLFDEPTAWIDIAAEESIFHLLHELRREKNLTVLIISHDLNVVFREASSVLCLNKEMICHGHPREVLTPAALGKLYGEKPHFYTHGKHHG